MPYKNKKIFHRNKMFLQISKLLEVIKNSNTENEKEEAFYSLEEITKFCIEYRQNNENSFSTKILNLKDFSESYFFSETVKKIIKQI